MVTAYDFPSATHADRAGVDVLLVGDSVGMTQMGYSNTLPVTMEDMLLHCRAARRGCARALLVADMPFGSYEACAVKAQENAYRLIKDGGADCVKLEGGSDARARTVERIVGGGVAVMAHIGLTPQAFTTLGGFISQAKTATKACELIHQAIALQEAGASAIVIECVPAQVAAAVTRAVSIPTLGIGAGPLTDGQVLVYHDLIGMTERSHVRGSAPRFCKSYALIGPLIAQALGEYCQEVKSGAFPSDEYSPYQMSAKQAQVFEKAVEELLEGDEQPGEHSNTSWENTCVDSDSNECWGLEEGDLFVDSEIAAIRLY